MQALGMERNQASSSSSSSAPGSAYALVAPLGHFVVDWNLEEAVTLQERSNFLQSLKEQHTGPH